MKKACKLLISILFCIACLYQQNTNAAIVGNRTAVFIVTNSPIFPAADTDNTMLGFGFFKGGFTLQDATTSCTFSSVFPVSGYINMNGGTLYLLEDLILTGTVQLEGLGAIIGNGHAMQIPDSVDSLPANLTLIKDLNIFFNEDLELNSTVTIQGNCSINCGSNAINFNVGAGFVVDNNSSIVFEDGRLEGVGYTNLRCVDDTGKIGLNNINVCLHNDWTYEHGYLSFKNMSTIVNEYLFSYESNIPLVIEDESTLLLDGELTFKTGRKTIGGPDPINFYDDESILTLGICNLIVTGSGLGITKGVFTVNKVATITTESTNTARGLIFGDGIDEENDAAIRLNAGSITTLNGTMVYNDVEGNAFDQTAPRAQLTVSPGSIFHLATTATLGGMTLQIDWNTTTSSNIRLASGTTMYLHSTRIIIPNAGDATYTGRIEASDQDHVRLYSNDIATLTSGSLIYGTRVIKSGNIIQGVGSTQGPIDLVGPSSSFFLNLQGSVQGPLALAKGTMTLLNDVTVIARRYSSGGTINLGSFILTRNPQGNIFSGGILYQGDNGIYSLIRDVTLTGTWTIQGNVTLNGNGGTLTLAAPGAIKVLANSQLTIKDINIEGIYNDALVCTDNSAKIVLDNSTLGLASDVDFKFGSFNIKNNSQIFGPYTFTYSSTLPSTITENSTLLLDGNMQYILGRPTVTGPDPIIFASKSSTLACGACSILITCSGFHITKGIFEVTNATTIVTTSTNPTCGLVFGDGIYSANDAIIKLNSGTITTLQSGSATYNNKDGDGFAQTAPQVQLTVSPDAIFNLYTTATFGNMTLQIDWDATTSSNIKLIFDTKMYLNNTRIVIPNMSDATYTGRIGWNNMNVVCLDTNDIATLTSGSLIYGTRVIKSGNIIQGVGITQGPIELVGPSSSFTLNLQGALQGPLLLNDGTMTLLNDVTVGSRAIVSGGIFDLGSSTLIRNPYKASIFKGALTYKGNNGTYSLIQDVTLTGTWFIEGIVTVNGNNGTFTMDGGRIIVNPGAELTLANVKLANLFDGCVSCDPTGTIILNNTSFILTEDVNFPQGTLRFVNANSFLGPHTFTYSSVSPSMIMSNSNLLLDQGLTLSISRATPGGADPLLFESDQSRLILERCGIYVNSNGIGFTHGRTNVLGSSIITVESTDTSYGIIFGNNSAEDDFTIYLGPGCLAEIHSGVITYNNVNNNRLTAASTASRIEVATNGAMYFANDGIVPFCTLQLDYDGIHSPAISPAPGKKIYFSSTRVFLPGFSDATFNGYIPGSNTLVLDEQNYFYSSSGALLFPTLVIGSQNLIGGVGNVENIITLSNNASSLELNLIGQINNRVSLNGGTVSLLGDITLTVTDCFVTTGTINIGSNTAEFHTNTMATYSVPINWISSSGTILLMRDIILTSTWTLNGNILFDCNGNTITFANGGAIAVGPSANVVIKNGILNNVVANSIYCTDDTGSLTLYRSTWSQNEDVTFSRGALNYRGAVFMTGQNTQFTYASTATSTILSDSILNLDNQFTFSYAPSNNSPYLLNFIDNTSQLVLNHTTLYLSPGLHATKGILRVGQAPTLYPLGIGLIFGDETVTDSSADMQLIFLDNSPLRIADGGITWQDLNISSLQAWAGGVMEFSATATLTLYRNLDLNPNGVVFSNGYYYHRMSPCPVTSDVTPGIQGTPTEGDLC